MLNNFVNLLAFLDANICVPTPRLQNSEKKLVYIFFARNKPTFLSSPCLCVCVYVGVVVCTWHFLSHWVRWIEFWAQVHDYRRGEDEAVPGVHEKGR